MKKELTKWFYREDNVPPYTHLAVAYDDVMNHVNYEKWADFIITLFIKFGSDIYRIIDGGCGTGSLLKVFVRRGMQVAGFDRSFEMVRLARRKVQVPLWVDDLRTFSLNAKWDAILFLYDTIQYLTIEEIQKLLYHVREALRPGGLFIFDAVTEYHVLKYWANYTEKMESHGLEILRKSWYVKNKRSQHTEFKIFDNDHKNIRCEYHVQYIYPFETYIKVSGESGFKFVGQFQDFTLNPGNEKSDRIHFVYKREAI